MLFALFHKTPFIETQFQLGLTRANRIYLSEQVLVESTCSNSSRKNQPGVAELAHRVESTCLNSYWLCIYLTELEQAHFIRTEDRIGSRFSSRERESLWLMDDSFNRFKQLVKEKRGKGIEKRNRGLRRSVWIKSLALPERKTERERERERRAWKFWSREIYSCESRSFTGDRCFAGSWQRKGKKLEFSWLRWHRHTSQMLHVHADVLRVRATNKSLVPRRSSLPRCRATPSRAEPSFPLFLFTSRESATG